MSTTGDLITAASWVVDAKDHDQDLLGAVDELAAVLTDLDAVLREPRSTAGTVASYCPGCGEQITADVVLDGIRRGSFTPGELDLVIHTEPIRHDCPTRGGRR